MEVEDLRQTEGQKLRARFVCLVHLDFLTPSRPAAAFFLCRHFVPSYKYRSGS